MMCDRTSCRGEESSYVTHVPGRHILTSWFPLPSALSDVRAVRHRHVDSPSQMFTFIFATGMNMILDTVKYNGFCVITAFSSIRMSVVLCENYFVLRTQVTAILSIVKIFSRSGRIALCPILIHFSAPRYNNLL